MKGKRQVEKEKPTKKRLFSRRGDVVTLIVLIALTLTTLAVNGLNAAGLRLVRSALYVFLPLLTALVAIGWGLSGIVRRVRGPVLKRVVMIAAVLVMLTLTALALQYGSFVAGLTLPQCYAVMTAPDGAHRLIVMRTLDTDEARTNARRDARRAAHPDSSEDYVVDDWGYVYTAYAPGPLGLFYKPASLIEGEVCIGYATGGELMLEWEAEGTVGRFFIKNPGPGDGGEMRARAE